MVQALLMQLVLFLGVTAFAQDAAFEAPATESYEENFVLENTVWKLEADRSCTDGGPINDSFFSETVEDYTFIISPDFSEVEISFKVDAHPFAFTYKVESITQYQFRAIPISPEDVSAPFIIEIVGSDRLVALFPVDLKEKKSERICFSGKIITPMILAD